MKIIATFSSLVIASAIVVAGCKAPATDDANAAKPAGDEATASASKSAGEARDADKKVDVRKPAAKSAVARRAETVTPATKIKNVQPVYPAIARAANVEGYVLLAVKVDKNGKVSDTKVIRSSPLLDQAAVDAVRQWEYRPMRRGNVAVPTTMMVKVDFVRS